MEMKNFCFCRSSLPEGILRLCYTRGGGITFQLTQEEFNDYLEMFKYMDGKGICIGDIQLFDERRVLLFS